jgi:hypothetical protein
MLRTTIFLVDLYMTLSLLFYSTKRHYIAGYIQKPSLYRNLGDREAQLPYPLFTIYVSHSVPAPSPLPSSPSPISSSHSSLAIS